MRGWRGSPRRSPMPTWTAGGRRRRPGGGGRLVSLAAGARRLPAVTAALAAGRIDVPRAVVFTDELAGLGDVAAAAVAAVAVTGAAGLTTGQLREVLRRAVLARDPGAARERRRRAQQQARVECWAEAAGTAALAGRDLPPAEALAADQQVDAHARHLKAAGAGGAPPPPRPP